MTSNWRFAVLLAGVVLLAGCAGGPGDTASATPATQSSPSSSVPSETTTAVPNESPTATQPSPPTRTATPSDTETLTVTVTAVLDGDTIDVRLENGTTDTVRLLGVDTPEVHTAISPDEFEGVADTDPGRTCLREWGRSASAYASEHLAGETVTLVFDDAADRRGFYGRLLAYVVVDDQNFNYRLVAEGYARVYDSSFTQAERFYDAEAAAKRSGAGLWECRSESAVRSLLTSVAASG